MSPLKLAFLTPWKLVELVVSFQRVFKTSTDALKNLHLKVGNRRRPTASRWSESARHYYGCTWTKTTFNLVPRVFVPLDQRPENESSGSNLFRQWNRIGRITRIRLFQNGCSQSSRFSTAGLGERRLWERDWTTVWNHWKHVWNKRNHPETSETQTAEITQASETHKTNRYHRKNLSVTII